MRRLNPTPKELESLRKLIEDEKLSQAKTAVRLGWPLRRVQRLVHRHKMKTQPPGPRPGNGHPSWKGGRIVDKDGYSLIWSPDHPNRRTYTRYVLEHRLVMEKHLGRYLLPEEVVHHRNKNKQDNRIENLQLFSENSEHLRHELIGKCPKWTKAGKASLQRQRWSAEAMHHMRSKRGANQKRGKTHRSTG